jgi:hypothetical protein
MEWVKEAGPPATWSCVTGHGSYVVRMVDNEWTLWTVVGDAAPVVSSHANPWACRQAAATVERQANEGRLSWVSSSPVVASECGRFQIVPVRVTDAQGVDRDAFQLTGPEVARWFGSYRRSGCKEQALLWLEVLEDRTLDPLAGSLVARVHAGMADLAAVGLTPPEVPDVLWEVEPWSRLGRRLRYWRDNLPLSDAQREVVGWALHAVGDVRAVQAARFYGEQRLSLALASVRRDDFGRARGYARVNLLGRLEPWPAVAGSVFDQPSSVAMVS